MGKCLSKYLMLFGLLLCALLLVASAASVISPDTRLQGYSRLLKREAVASCGQPGPITDCLMQEALLRRQGVIPDDQLETLRAFCRKAAAGTDDRQPLRGSTLASLDETP